MHKVVLLFVIILFITTPLFASDNYGIDDSMNIIKKIAYGFGGTLIVFSIAFWAIKGIALQKLDSKDAVTIICIFLSGLLLVLAPTLASLLLGDEGLGRWTVWRTN